MNCRGHIRNHTVRIPGQIDHARTHRRAGINRNLIDRGLNDLTVIDGNHQVVGRILDQERLAHGTNTFCRRTLDAAHAAGRTAFEDSKVFAAYSLRITALRYDNHFPAGFLPLHGHHSISLTERNALHTVGLTAHRPNIADRIRRTITLAGRNHDIIRILHHHSRANLVTIVQLDNKQTAGTHMRKCGHRQTLRHAVLRDDHQILIISIILLGNHPGHLLALLELGKHADQGRTARSPAGLSDLIGLHGIHTAVIGEEDQIRQGRRRDHILDIIIAQRRHMAALAALLLQAERTWLHTLQITEIGANHHTRLIFDQVFHRQIRIVNLMLGLTVISVFPADLLQFLPDLTKQRRRICQQTFTPQDLLLQL